MTWKNVIANLIKGEKLDKTIYMIWHGKILYLPNEVEVLRDHYKNVMEYSEEDNTLQHRINVEAYQI